MTGARSRILVAAMLALSAAGCGSVPDLLFADTGSRDAAAAGPDGAAPTGTDGSIADGATSAPGDATADAISDGAIAPVTCPATPPPAGVTACCGASACVDRENQGNCAQCSECLQLACKSAEICCYSAQGNLNCRKTAADCK